MMFKVNGKHCKTIEEVALVATPEFCGFLEEWYSGSDYVTAFTSGSTGAPKEIKLLKSDMEASAGVTNRFFNINESSKLLLCLSPGYIAGKMMIVRWLLSGSEIIVHKPSSNPLSGLDAQIDFAAMVPSQVINILDDNVIAGRLSSVKDLIIGGAPLDTVTEGRLRDITTRCYATYGMTETLSHVALRRINSDEEYFAVGDISFGLDDRGCLVIDTPHLSVKRIVTNDIVKLSDSRHFLWLGRYDNVINSGGIKIFPEETEKILRPYVSERFYIVGKPDKIWGEKCVLVIEGSEWGSDKITAIKTVFNKELHHHKAPKDIYFMERFEETSSGKVIRILPE